MRVCERACETPRYGGQMLRYVRNSRSLETAETILGLTGVAPRLGGTSSAHLRCTHLPIALANCFDQLVGTRWSRRRAGALFLEIRRSQTNLWSELASWLVVR